MILHLGLLLLLVGYCHSESAKGLVYYPPYIDPYADQNPCTQMYEWDELDGMSGHFGPPKQDSYKECRGSFSNIPFIAPAFTAPTEREQVEDYYVDTNAYDKNFNLEFLCKDGSGKMRSGLYFWVYLFRQSGVIKSYSYQTMMAWDTEGKLIFQPVNHRSANISCRYYDSVKGYTIPIRTWRLSFTRSPPVQLPETTTVETYLCNSSRPTLASNREVNVVVTSNMLQFPQFCPVVSCVINSPQEFSAVTFLPRHEDACPMNAVDPASYPVCSIDPLSRKELAYTCSAGTLGNKQGTVKISIKSGARFLNDADFKPLYFKEDERDSPLSCSVDPVTAPDSIPTWEFMPASSGLYGGKYQPVTSSLYRQQNDMTGGNHRLYITTVKPEHEGSYRCTVPQSSRIVPGGKPIYGYYFVKVYPKPICTPYDGETSQALTIDNNGAVNIDLRLMSNSYVTMQCSQLVSQCNTQQCTPIAILRKGNDLCAMSNTTGNTCGGTQRITTSSSSPGILRIDVTLNNNGGADASVIEQVRGSYTVQLYYPEPASLEMDVPFKIVAAPAQTGALNPPIVKGDGSLWWIVLIIAGVILIVLILFVIGYCLRQSGQTYPVDKKERDAGHDPVKELRDAGFSDLAAQPPHSGSEPSISGSVKVPEDSDSLGEYGEIDPTKFNEDGSFIHQYGPGQHPRNGNQYVPQQAVVPTIPGPPPTNRSGPAPPPRPERTGASRMPYQQGGYHPGGTNV